jgi:hypothetical protein
MDVRMKKVFLFIAIGLLLLAIPATIFFLSQQRNIRARAAPATTLSLTPAIQTVTAGQANIKLNVDIDPGTNQVISAKIYLTYDPTKLEAKTITNGSSAPRVLNSGVIENGTASINVGAAGNSQPITARGTIAVITFTAKAATGNISPASVQFASNTFVGGLNETTANVLIGTTPAKITIAGANTTGANFTSDATPAATPTAALIPLLTLTPAATPTATLIPTLIPTIPASGSALATPSAVQILEPVQNADVASSQPVISGTAPAGSTVTIVIHSDAGITVTVTADTNGNWVYTPAAPLDPGLHSVVASAQTATGITQTATTSFVVASGAGTDATAASVSAIPVSGSIETTLLLLSVGILFILSGALVWHF